LPIAAFLLAGPAQQVTIAQGGAPAAPAQDKPLSELDPNLKTAVASIKKLEGQAKAKPKDAKIKSSLADAYYKAGNVCTTSPSLPPRLKYRTALGYYRQCLKLNPKHAKALAEKKTIEDIYKQMGRPIPE
jgi:tetratricopeptide (TPR) repeat protein